MLKKQSDQEFMQHVLGVFQTRNSHKTAIWSQMSEVHGLRAGGNLPTLIGVCVEIKTLGIHRTVRP